ncbi:hypothetical protein AB0H83_13265 [Dactylosporangium sp. NPDC050688]|uniref:hypothetical protein n=1 Tax=Dactylosporangium sp. NPDC050688 TaxID=3157217 RepID=UPI00340E1DFE
MADSSTGFGTPDGADLVVSLFNLHSGDATGRGRMQLLDHDRVVVAQSERASSSPDFTERIMPRVVKFGEPTGDSGCDS